MPRAFWLMVFAAVTGSWTLHAQRNWPEVTKPDVSPVVTWDSWGNISRPPTKRPLTAAELKSLRQRADQLYALVKATPTYSQVTDRIKLMTAWPVVADTNVIEEVFYLYWTRPSDARRRPDGSIWPKVGGSHELRTLTLNAPPTAPQVRAPGEPGDEYWRPYEGGGPVDGVFAEPRVYAQVAGGTLYATQFVLTRDGRSMLESAPLVPLLEGEIARYKKSIAEQDALRKGRLEELEASNTPEARANRRARRTEAWKNRQPAALAKELDAADKSDDSYYSTTKAEIATVPPRDPKNTYWAARLALEAVETRLASLTAAERNGGACGRSDPAFGSSESTRFEPVGSMSGCVPMVRVRKDLVNPKRPSDVMVLRLGFGDAACGRGWDTPTAATHWVCQDLLALVRELDWAAVRQILGW